MLKVVGKAEVAIPKAGVGGGFGFADIVNPYSYVWEVKPDNIRYNEKSMLKIAGTAQLQRYITFSAIYSSYNPLFPLRAGYAVSSYTLAYNAKEDIQVRSGYSVSNSLATGLVLYKVVEKNKSQTQTQTQEAMARQTVPDPNLMKSQYIAAGVLVGIFVIKGLVCLALSGPTFGASLAFIVVPV